MPTTTFHSLIEELALEPRLGPQLVHTAYLPGQDSAFRDPDPALPEPLERALRRSGIDRIYSHQADGIDAARAGKDVLITTPTASGKSLVFQVPILETALRGEEGRALFLFPLKALGQDQRTKFDEMAAAAGLYREARCEIYDGDTPHKKRAEIRQDPPRVLVSNPDMLHYGILTHPANWGELLRTLRYIVLDELHTYRGIFGAHFYHVLQRLLRLCRQHGSNPVIIASSATANNAAEFAKRLTGRDFHVVDQSGAAREGRHFLLYQPETSPYTTSLQLFTNFVEAGLKTIMFTKARRVTELLHSWLSKQTPHLRNRVANYRAGFLPQERRDIERRLFEGTLDGVISTSALEMGIDVGGLDACVLVGFPGSMMATWQRSGRVGRQGRESITALVALPDALDQYLLANPDAFLNRACENLVVSPGNAVIGERHLLCAASELPLDPQADQAYLTRHQPLVEDLVERFELATGQSGRELHCVKKPPHRAISLRGGGSTYSILSTVTGKTIGTVDGIRTLRECHPGAVYLHGGKQYLIVELDQPHKRALAEPSRVDYFTSPLGDKDTEILEVLDEREDGPLRSWLGRVRVTERVIGFERKRIMSQEKLGQEALDLPPVVYETTALWFTAGRDIEETLRENNEDFMGALHAGEHAAISLFPVLALCDRGDLGGISIPYHPQLQSGGVFIYDGHGGGAGIAETGFERLPELLDRVEELLDACDCEGGCPSCIHSPKCGNGNRPLDKEGAKRLVRLLRGREQPSETALALAGSAEAPPTILLDAQAESRDFDLDRGRALDETPRSTSQPGPGRVFRWTPEEGSRPALTPRGRGGNKRHTGPSLFDLEAPLPEEAAAPLAAPAAAPEQSPETTLPERPPRELRRDTVENLKDTLYDRPARPDRPAPVAPTSAAEADRRPRRAQPLRRAAIPRRIERTVLFDVETKRSAEEVGGWHQLHRLGVALAVTCDLEENRFSVYREEQVPALIEELRSADLVIGFNVMRFDYPVLSGYTGEDFRRTLPTLDLFEHVHQTVGFRLGLAHLTQATLGVSKIADGLQSIEWYRQGDFARIEEYCRSDVELLRDLYLFGRREGHICCEMKKRKGRRKVKGVRRGASGMAGLPGVDKDAPEVVQPSIPMSGQQAEQTEQPEPARQPAPPKIVRIPVNWP